MPRKALAEPPYDPIATDLVRQALVPSPPASPTSSPVSTPLLHTVVSVPPDKGTLPPEYLPRSPGASTTKRFVLNASENEKLNAFLFRLEQNAKTKVSFSVVMRAMLRLIMQAEKNLLVELAHGFPIALPSTHDSFAQAAFEEEWIKRFAAVFCEFAQRSSEHSAACPTR